MEKELEIQAVIGFKGKIIYQNLYNNIFCVLQKFNIQEKKYDLRRTFFIKRS
jgi:hypothetical protein